MTDVSPSSQLVADVLIAVTALPGGMFWRANTGVSVTPRGAVVAFNLPGTPDILGCYFSQGVGFECKYGSGRLSKEQKIWCANWVRSGGIYVTTRSVDGALDALASIRMRVAA